MSYPKTKTELLDTINKTFTQLMVELKKVPDEAARTVCMDGHAKNTCMSAANLVAYLIGWGELVIKWHEKKQRGEQVDFPETGFKWNELGRLAQKFYRDYDCLSYQELLGRLADTKCRVIAIVEARSNKELFGQPWHGDWRLGRILHMNSSAPYKNARARLRKWNRSQT